MPAGPVEPGVGQGYVASLSMEMAEPKYPTVPTLGNKKAYLCQEYGVLPPGYYKICRSLAASYR